MRVAITAAVRVVFFILAAAAIIVAVRINMAALAAIGGSNGAMLSVVALMSAAVKAAVPLYREHVGRVPYSLGAVFALAIAFDAGCALAFAAKVRAGHEAVSRTNSDAIAAVARLRSELSAAEARHRSATGADVAGAADRLEQLEAAARAQRFELRTPATVRAALAAAEVLAGDCRGRTHTDVCKAPGRLRIELADAEGREAAAAALEAAKARAAIEPAALLELRNQLKAAEAGAAAPVERDWFAVGLAGLAASVGVTLPEEWASRAFAVLLTVFIELLAVFGLAAAFRPVPATAEPMREVQPRPVVGAIPTPPKGSAAAAEATTPKTGVIRQGAALDAVRAWLASATAGPDGWIYATQRTIAEAASVSGAAANSALRALAAAGKIELRAGRRGTAIKLL